MYAVKAGCGRRSLHRCVIIPLLSLVPKRLPNDRLVGGCAAQLKELETHPC